MLVTDFSNNFNKNIPDEFYDSIPHFCPEEGCGYPLEMTEALTQLHCSNPRCPSKVVQRLIAIANQLGVKDLGEAKATKFIQKFGITNPLLIFQYEPVLPDGSVGNGPMGEGISLEVSKKIIDQFMARNKFTLPEYIKIANLPFIQSSALSVFGDYDDLSKAFADIEAGGVSFIAKKLDIKKAVDEVEDVSIRALKVYDSLMTFKQDLFDGLGGVEIIKTHSVGIKTIKAVCSDEVGSPYRTKADFYATINNRYNTVHVEFLNAVNANIDFLVWAGADGSLARYTNKVKKVEAYNAKYEDKKAAGKLKEGDHYIPIMTAMQFMTYLDGLGGIKHINNGRQE